MYKTEFNEFLREFDINNISRDWLRFFEQEWQKNYFKELLTKIDDEYSSSECYPSKKNIFRIFRELDLKEVKVVIIGQDPYHIPEVADGIAFSSGLKNYIPASLRNILLELRDDTGSNINISTLNGDLSLIKWVRKGVFLINTSLTVKKRTPTSHSSFWNDFFLSLMKYVKENSSKIVWIFWGEKAKKMKDFLGIRDEESISSSHPSPYSCNIDFFGSKPFSRTNEILKKWDKSEIDWFL